MCCVCSVAVFLFLLFACCVFSPAQGGLPLVTVLSILAQVCSGLRHLHSLGILHRDLRTVNVLVTSNDPLRVALADFGLSHLLTSVAQRPVSGPGMWGVDLRVSTLGSSALVGEVSGVEALGPCLWTAPETCVATQSGGVVVTALYVADDLSGVYSRCHRILQNRKH